MAELATPGPWRAWDALAEGGGIYVSAPKSTGNYTFGIEPGLEGVFGLDVAQDDAALIAVMHPGVALALANCLEKTAARAKGDDDRHWIRFNSDALAVAHAVLGES